MRPPPKKKKKTIKQISINIFYNNNVMEILLFVIVLDLEMPSMWLKLDQTDYASLRSQSRTCKMLIIERLPKKSKYQQEMYEHY